jgi:hypothetical protein
MYNYDEEWQKYRDRRFAYIALSLGFFPVAPLVFSLNRLFSINWAGDLLVPYMILWIVAGARFESFRCPRCGKSFARTWWYNLSFIAWKCVHCGLKKFSDGE